MKVLARWVLPIACCPLLNVYSRAHWAKRRKLKRECMLRMLAQNGRRQQPLPGKPKVLVTRFSARAPDADSGLGAKLPLDCLVDLGWLRDDAPDAIELSLAHRKNSGLKNALVVEVCAP